MRVALVVFCAQVWTTNPSALAKIPVTSSAPQTVQPCGTDSSRHGERRRAATNAASISTSVKPIAS